MNAPHADRPDAVRPGPRPRQGRIVAGGPLAGAAALMGLTIFLSFSHARAPADAGGPPGSIVRERLLQFADREDGAVIVTDGTDGRAIKIITGENGFLRGTMSGLTRIRWTEGIGRSTPFKLTLYAGHRLILSDPATGKNIELEAFGPSNEAVFAALL